MYTGADLDVMPDALAFFMYWDLPLNGPFLSGNGLVLRGTDARADAFRVHSRGQFPKMANYSFDIGNSHWTVLDTYDVDLDWSDPHLRAWLAADLAAAKSATWRFVSCYQSPFMSSNAEDKPNNPLYLWNKMRGIVDLFQEGGVDIVFGGCAHVYERLHPLWFTPNQVPTPLKDPFTRVDGVFQIDDDFVGDGGRRPEGVLYVVTGNGPWLGPNMTNQPYTNIYFPDPNNDANPPIKKSFTVLAGC